MADEVVCKDFFLGTKMFFEWFPDESKLTVLKPSSMSICRLSSHKESIKSKVRKQSSICLRMTKCIDHPANVWLHTKFSLQELMADIHVKNHILIVCACFICGNPASLGNFKLTILNDLLNLIFHLLIQVFIPSIEELHVDKGKLSCKVFIQLVHYTVENRLGGSSNRIHVCSRIILIK